MSISLHCESCKKKIKAPDVSGGKWGNCPFCNHRCYIPRPPSSDDEELKLAPVDASDETRYGQLMRETRDLRQNILQEKELPDGRSSADAKLSEKELTKEIVVYLRYMADGELGLAAGPMGKIAANKDAAPAILKNMARAERPEPELLDVPPKVLNSLIKNLYSKLK
jgi:hypothetical protein